MKIISCHGYELEKEKPNTSEDFFNRSEVKIEENGKETVFRVLYLRYFEEQLYEFIPFQENPIYTVGSRNVELKDIVALACILKNPDYQNRKQVYINNSDDFTNCLEGLNFEAVFSVFDELEKDKFSILRSPHDYLVQ